MPEATTYRNALPLQSLLLEYRLESVLGAGGFGMTYLGWDTHLEKHVAIKEYLPTDIAVRALDGSIVPITTELQRDYQWGLERFILEARTLGCQGLRDGAPDAHRRARHQCEPALDSQIHDRSPLSCLRLHFSFSWRLGGSIS